MERVAIIGPGGAGKSTLARRLGELTGLPVVHLDTEYWRPGWVPTPEEEWHPRVDELAHLERWIIDGNYGGTMEPRLERADTVIYLDFERHTYIGRVLKRRYQHRDRGRSRPDMAEGCEEKIDWVFLKWLWNYPATRRPEALRLLANAHRLGKRAVILRDDRQVRAFLADVASGVTPRPVRLHRVNLVAGAGAGKSTLGTPLGERACLPAIDLGTLFGEVGQSKGALRGQRRLVAEVANGPRWILEGSFWRTLDLRLQSSDLAIFLDRPSHVRIWRIVRRRRDPLRVELVGLFWAPLFALSERRRIRRILGRAASCQPVFVTRTDAEAAAVLEGLAPVPQR